MVKFSLSLRYEGESCSRAVATGCSKKQLLDVLLRHLMLAEVSYFKIYVHEGKDCPDKFIEFSL